MSPGRKDWSGRRVQASNISVTPANPRSKPGPGNFPLVKNLVFCALLLAGFSFGSDIFNSSAWGVNSITILWPATGCLIGILLCTPRRHWPVYIVVGFAVDQLVNVVFTPEQPLLLRAYLSGCSMLEVSLAALLLHPTFGKGRSVSRPEQLVRLLVFGAIVAPGIASIASAFGLSGFTGDPILRSFAQWFTADGLGNAIIIPLYLGLNKPPRLSERNRLEIALLLTLLCAVGGVVFWQNELPLLYGILPFLLLVEIRLGLAGSAIGLLAISVIGGYATAHGHGPVSLSHYTSLLSRTLALQGFVLVCLLFLYIADVVIEQKDRFEHDLRSSERLFRLLTENSFDLIMLHDSAAKRVYASPSVKRMLGWQQEELRSMSREDLIHPDDLPAYLEAFNECRASQFGNVDFRARKKDGDYLWLQINLVANQDPATMVTESFVSVTRDISRQKAAEEELHKALGAVETLARVDALTGVANRRTFDAHFDSEWLKAARSQTALSMLMIDVDHFKKYNDQFGHLAGDQCLRDVAQAISSCVKRPSDLMARYGGEEFAVICPATAAREAQSLAEQIREAIVLKQIPHPASAFGHVTACIGCATMTPAQDMPAARLIQCADRALYEGKSSGRNRVVVYDEQCN